MSTPLDRLVIPVRVPGHTHGNETFQRAARVSVRPTAVAPSTTRARSKNIPIIRLLSDSCCVNGEFPGDVHGAFAGGALAFAQHHRVDLTSVYIIDNSLHLSDEARDNWRRRHWIDGSAIPAAAQQEIQQLLIPNYRRADLLRDRRERRTLSEEELRVREASYLPRAIRRCEEFQRIVTQASVLHDPPNDLRNKRLVAGDVLAALVQHPKPLDGVAIFCHGWSGGIQIGFGGRGRDVRNLAQALSPEGAARNQVLRVVLYACGAGGGENEGHAWRSLYEHDGPCRAALRAGREPALDNTDCFAAQLRDELVGMGQLCTVDAHADVGHSYRNPNVRRFDGTSLTYAHQRGQWIHRPGDDIDARWEAWNRALANDRTIIWEFPFLSREQIAHCLGATARSAH